MANAIFNATGSGISRCRFTWTAVRTRGVRGGLQMKLHRQRQRNRSSRESRWQKRIVEFLREDLDLTGAKNACDIGACGACTILVNDEPMRICIKLREGFCRPRAC